MINLVLLIGGSETNVDHCTGSVCYLSSIYTIKGILTRVRFISIFQCKLMDFLSFYLWINKLFLGSRYDKKGFYVSYASYFVLNLTALNEALVAEVQRLKLVAAEVNG